MKPGQRVQITRPDSAIYDQTTGTVVRAYQTAAGDAWLVALDQVIPWPYARIAAFTRRECRPLADDNDDA